MILPQSAMFIPTPLALLFIAWSLVWKGLALWRAARNQHKWWFVALLILNTAGLLEIAYLIFVDKQEVFKYCRAYWAKMKEAEAKASPTAKASPVAEATVDKSGDKLEDKENKI